MYKMIKILENQCNNLNELKPLMFRSHSGTSYGIGSQSYQKEQNDSKKLEDFISTFRRYE